MRPSMWHCGGKRFCRLSGDRRWRISRLNLNRECRPSYVRANAVALVRPIRCIGTNIFVISWLAVRWDASGWICETLRTQEAIERVRELARPSQTFRACCGRSNVGTETNIFDVFQTLWLGRFEAGFV